MQNQWYIARDGKQYGPISDADLAQLVQNREILDGDYLWRQGFDNWLPAGQVHEVRRLSEQPQGRSPLAGKPFAPAGGPEEGAGAQTDPLSSEQISHQNPDQSDHAFHMKRDDLRRSLDAEVAGEQLLPQDGAPLQDAQAEPMLGGTDLGFSAKGQNVQDLIEVQEHNDYSGFDPHSVATPAADEAYQTGVHDAFHQNPTGEPKNHDPMGGHTPMSAQAPFARDAAFANQRPFEGQSLDEQARQANRTAEPAGAPTKGGKLSWPLGLGIGAAALLLLIVGATFALPYLVPPETIKKQIAAALKEKTGRDVSFKGKMSYRFLPSFGLDLNKIVIHNPPQIKGPDFVSIGRLQASLKLLPLLGKRVEIDRIVLHRPEVALITAGGRTNYDLSTNTSQSLPLRSFQVAQSGDDDDLIANTLDRLAQEESEKDAQKAKLEKEAVTRATASGQKGQFQVGEIEIINGALKFIDQSSNSEREVNAINLKLQAPSAEKDVTVMGTVRYLEDRVQLVGTLSTLGDLLGGQPVKAVFNANSDRFEGQFQGELTAGDAFTIKGETDVQTFSLQKLLNWFGVDVPPQGYGGAYVRGRLSGNGHEFALNNATLKFDQNILIGAVRVYPQGARPKIEATLKTDRLDLTPYLAQKNRIQRSSLGAKKRSVAAWSSEKIDFSFLKMMDGTVQLDARKLIAMGHTVEKTRLNAKMNSGLMTAQLPKFLLYGGSGSLSVAVNGAKARPTIKSRLNLKDVQIKPLLQKGAGWSFISGTASAALQMVGSGNTQQEFVSTLYGAGKVDVSNGALEGLNIPGMLRNLQSGNLLQATSKPTEKTDFSELSGNFAIERGIIKNNDLLMKGPLLRMSGKGSVSLPAETVDYQLSPKLVASLRGQGGRGDLQGVVVPLRVKGPWASPKIVPDLKGALSDPQAIEGTVNSVKKIIKNVKKKKITGEDMKNLLNGMIDGNGEQGNLLEGILQ